MPRNTEATQRYTAVKTTKNVYQTIFKTASDRYARKKIRGRGDNCGGIFSQVSCLNQVKSIISEYLNLNGFDCE